MLWWIVRWILGKAGWLQCNIKLKKATKTCGVKQETKLWGNIAPRPEGQSGQTKTVFWSEFSQEFSDFVGLKKEQEADERRQNKEKHKKNFANFHKKIFRISISSATNTKSIINLISGICRSKSLDQDWLLICGISPARSQVTSKTVNWFLKIPRLQEPEKHPSVFGLYLLTQWDF